MKRYLIISDEIDLSRFKPTRYTHFDIVPGRDIDSAIEKLKKYRKNIIHTTYLSIEEIESIHNAMIVKKDKTLVDRLRRIANANSINHN